MPLAQPNATRYYWQISCITSPAIVNPKMAVMCAVVPLICAFDEHHSWLASLGVPSPIGNFGHMQALVPQALAGPLLDSSSLE